MFDLKTYLPYLLNRAGSLLATRATRDLRQFDITLPMWRVLAALYEEDGQRVSRLAESTSIDISTLSRVIGSMQTKELALRRREIESDPKGDQRAVTVFLSAKGRQVAETFVPLAENYEKIALQGFSDEEARSLKAFLVRVYQNLERL